MAIFKAHFVTFEQYGGSMPADWQKVTIGDVVTVTRGASPRPIQDYMSKTGMPWVKISDASASVSKYLFSTAECIIPEGVSSSRTVLPGMMIVSNSASPGLPMIMEITACVHDGWLIIVLFVTLPTSNYPKILQIIRRYSINYSDASYVRLFYPVPSVIISKSLINKRSRTRPDQSLVSCFTHSP